MRCLDLFIVSNPIQQITLCNIATVVKLRRDYDSEVDVVGLDFFSEIATIN